MLFRRTTESDLDGLLGCVVTEPVGWIPGDRFGAELAENQYRYPWAWIAEDDDGRILARALWWGQSDSVYPLALDCLYAHPSVDGEQRVEIAAGLLRAGHEVFRAEGAPESPGYNLNLANGWQDDPAAVNAVAWRREAATRAGLTHAVERLRFEWTPDLPVSEDTGRLVFTPEPDDEVFLALFTRVAQGSLDDETRKNLAALGAEKTARGELDFYLSRPGKREWWRVVRTPDGEPVGLSIPSATPYGPNVGYLGVVPEMRGKGYVDDVLADITRFHAASGAQRVTATTDTTNAPMAAAFARAGYRNTEVRLILSGAPE